MLADIERNEEEELLLRDYKDVIKERDKRNRRMLRGSSTMVRRNGATRILRWSEDVETKVYRHEVEMGDGSTNTGER